MIAKRDDESNAPRLLTVDQAANRLQVSGSIVYSLIEAGKLACHRIGLGRGTIRISVADLDAFLESCRQGERVADSIPRRKRLRHIDL